MPAYMEVRKHHSLLDICRAPELAAEVTITAAERLGVDAAIIFADLLLQVTPMGLDFDFIPGEGPIIHNPVRSLEQIKSLRTDWIEDLSYVARSIEKVVAHFAPRRGTADELGIIGFIGAPFTLASYIKGKRSRNYVEVKMLMYCDPSGWKLLMDKLVDVLGGYAEQQIAAGAEVIQIFDSWIGALNRRDYVTYALGPAKSLVNP
jgi:uroporphyrinogen decarboxylase